jgi:hypothetical protein
MYYFSNSYQTVICHIAECNGLSPVETLSSIYLMCPEKNFRYFNPTHKEHYSNEKHPGSLLCPGSRRRWIHRYLVLRAQHRQQDDRDRHGAKHRRIADASLSAWRQDLLRYGLIAAIK